MEEFYNPIIEKIMNNIDNAYCIDCGSPNPKWCSINNGVTLCLICAGQHRNFGVNVSYIRSLTIDSW